MTILEQAAQVLHEEARAIEELSSRLDQFCKCCKYDFGL